MQMHHATQVNAMTERGEITDLGLGRRYTRFMIHERKWEVEAPIYREHGYVGPSCNRSSAQMGPILRAGVGEAGVAFTYTFVLSYHLFLLLLFRFLAISKYLRMPFS